MLTSRRSAATAAAEADTLRSIYGSSATMAAHWEEDTGPIKADWTCSVFFMRDFTSARQTVTLSLTVLASGQQEAAQE